MNPDGSVAHPVRYVRSLAGIGHLPGEQHRTRAPPTALPSTPQRGPRPPPNPSSRPNPSPLALALPDDPSWATTRLASEARRLTRQMAEIKCGYDEAATQTSA